MNHPKLHAALLAAFCKADDQAIINEDAATAAADILGSLADAIAEAVVAASPVIESPPGAEMASAGLVCGIGQSVDAAAEIGVARAKSLFAVIADAITYARECDGDLSAAASKAAAAFRAGDVAAGLRSNGSMAPDPVARHLRLALSPRDGFIKIISPVTDTELDLPDADIEMLIEGLQNRNQIASGPELTSLDPSS